jgi:hypothetical protein
VVVRDAWAIRLRGSRTQHRAFDLSPTGCRKFHGDVREGYKRPGEHQTDELSRLGRTFESRKLGVAERPTGHAVESAVAGKRELRCFELLP